MEGDVLRHRSDFFLIIIHLYLAAVYLWIHRTVVHSLSLLGHISLDVYPLLIIYSLVYGSFTGSCYFNDSHLLWMAYRAPLSLAPSGFQTPVASLCQRLFHLLVSEPPIPFAPRIPCAAGLLENS